MPKLHIILEILEARNIPVNEFCKEINMSVPGFKRLIERNSTRLQTLETIANALHCPVGIFFNESKPEQKNSKQRMIPHIPLSAQAGSLGGFTEGIIDSGCELNGHIATLGSYDFTIDVRGESMMPEYRSGDIVACKKLQSGDSIRYGSVYILDTAQGVIMKRIERYVPDPALIYCVSLNSEFEPFLLSPEEIYGLSIVVGIIKSI
ncbi:MAG: S24 family peptidase [Bacteroidales bacterium]